MSQVRTSALNFIKKETPTQVFSCEYCKISKNNFLHGTSPVPASKVLPNPTTAVLIEPTFLQLGTGR